MPGLSGVLSQYGEASFRGVPFAMVASAAEQGRQVAMHTYPKRDSCWPEDMGRKPRVYSIRGFVSGPTCALQRDLLVRAAEQEGYGTFIHPEIGMIYVSVLRFGWAERDGLRNVIDVHFEFVEYQNSLVTTVLKTLSGAAGVARLLRQGSALSFSALTGAAFALGAPALGAATGVASGWAQGAVSLVRSPAALAGVAYGLSGNMGRYILSGHDQRSMPEALDDFTNRRAAVEHAAAALPLAPGADSLVPMVQQFPEQVAATCSDPEAKMRLLAPLTRCKGPAQSPPSPLEQSLADIGRHTAALCRVSALACIMEALSDWEPRSWDEVQAARTDIAARFDHEILYAANHDQGALYQTLRSAREQITDDLAQSAHNAARLHTIHRNSPVNALLLAQQLYADGARSVELIYRINPPHPAFMPTEMDVIND